MPRWAAALALLVELGCGSRSRDGAAAKVCAPGETQSCLGPGRCAGGQSCLATGTGWSACDCALSDGGAVVEGGGGGGAPDASGGGFTLAYDGSWLGLNNTGAPVNFAVRNGSLEMFTMDVTATFAGDTCRGPAMQLDPAPISFGAVTTDLSFSNASLTLQASVAFTSARMALGTIEPLLATGLHCANPFVIDVSTGNVASAITPPYMFSASKVDLVASGETLSEFGIARMAIDATSVYFATRDAIKKVPLGGGPVTSLASAAAFSIAVNATGVYWTDFNGGRVMSVPLEGGTPTPLAVNQMSPGGIAVDATNVYFTANLGGTVMKVPIAGGTAVALASGQVRPGGIAVDASNVYWANNGTVAATEQDGAIMKVSLAGGTPVPVVAVTTAPSKIVIDSETLYFTSDLSTSVMKVPLSGGAPVSLGGGLDFTGDLVVDATSVYWTTYDQKLMKVARGGGTATTVIATQGRRAALAADATRLYFTNPATGLVVSLPK